MITLFTVLFALFFVFLLTLLFSWLLFRYFSIFLNNIYSGSKLSLIIIAANMTYWNFNFIVEICNWGKGMLKYFTKYVVAFATFFWHLGTLILTHLIMGHLILGHLILTQLILGNILLEHNYDPQDTPTMCWSFSLEILDVCNYKYHVKVELGN